MLFLVPSINLLAQSIIEWANDAQVPLSTFAVCSDRHAGKRTNDEDMSGVIKLAEALTGNATLESLRCPVPTCALSASNTVSTL